MLQNIEIHVSVLGLSWMLLLMVSSPCPCLLEELLLAQPGCCAALQQALLSFRAALAISDGSDTKLPWPCS